MFEPVIGLEVHAQLLTASKAFCGCSAAFGDEPNTHACPVCLGLPGSLPVVNAQAVEFAIRFGLATHCTIARRSVFARKNYFYPDLPKGYQISQYEAPLCGQGHLEIDDGAGGKRRIRIKRIHLEEDAGKLIHDRGTLVDVNRCGVPLVELVTEPDLRSPREAALLVAEIRRIVTYLGICDGNMEEGSLRCDANISLRPSGSAEFGTKTEVKNLNSFRHVERALAFEIGRQERLLASGGAVEQETLFWNADTNTASPMRGKEEAHDYRYFPDPDLVPVEVDDAWLARVESALVELPAARRERFVTALGLPAYDASVLTAEKEIADYFEETVDRLGGGRGHAKQASNWVMTEVLRAAGGEDGASLKAFPVAPEKLARLILLVEQGRVSGSIAKEIFAELLESGGDPEEIIDRRGLAQISDPDEIAGAVAKVLAANAAQLERYRGGEEKLFGYFVGQVMKSLGGRGNPAVVTEILRKKLKH